MSCIGRVAISTAGRDRGRAMLTVGVADGNHLLLADGVTRKLAAPKKKKLKHLKLTDSVIDLTDGMCDADVRKALEAKGFDTSRE